MSPKGYYPVVESFLDRISEKNVKTICMVAVTDDRDDSIPCAIWYSNPEDIGAAASVLQMHATKILIDQYKNPRDELEENYE